MAKKLKAASAVIELSAKETQKLSIAQRGLMAELDKKDDLKATKENCVKDLLDVQQTKKSGKVGRDYYRLNGKYSDKTWSRHFGTWQEFTRVAGLSINRQTQQLESQLAKHAAHDIYKQYYIEKIAPYHGKYVRKGTASRMKTLLVGSDFHDKESDRFVLSVFIDTAKRLQPDIIVLNGDIFDNYEFSRFEHDPREYDIVGRINFVGNNIFKPLREACPNAQIDLIMGNHEFRLLKILANIPMLKALLADVIGLNFKNLLHPKFDEYEINLVSKIDLHAFTKSDEAQELSENYAVYYDCFVASHIKDWGMGFSGTSGHCHKPAFEYNTSLSMGRMSWMNTGCIAKTRVHYQEGVDKYANGFGIVHVDTLTKSVIQEPIVIPKDVAIVAGKYYFRTAA